MALILNNTQSLICYYTKKNHRRETCLHSWLNAFSIFQHKTNQSILFFYNDVCPYIIHNVIWRLKILCPAASFDSVILLFIPSLPFHLFLVFYISLSKFTVAKVLNCNIVVNEFELHTIHGKRMTLLIIGFSHFPIHNNYNFFSIPSLSCYLHTSLVAAKVLDIIVNEFEIKSRYYVYFRIDILGKGMNTLILLAVGYVVSLVFYKKCFGIV